MQKYVIISNISKRSNLPLQLMLIYDRVLFESRERNLNAARECVAALGNCLISV